MDLQKIALRIAHRVRAITVTDTVPVRTGELRRSITAQRYSDGAVVGTNKLYAAAVHEGRRAVIIRPKRKKALFWKGARHPVRQVFQPARKGKPFLTQAVDRFEDNLDNEVQGLEIQEEFKETLRDALKNKGLNVRDA